MTLTLQRLKQVKAHQPTVTTDDRGDVDRFVSQEIDVNDNESPRYSRPIPTTATWTIRLGPFRFKRTAQLVLVHEIPPPLTYEEFMKWPKFRGYERIG